LIQTFAQNHR